MCEKNFNVFEPHDDQCVCVCVCVTDRQVCQPNPSPPLRHLSEGWNRPSGTLTLEFKVTH